MTAPLDAEADATVSRFYWLKRLAGLSIIAAIALVALWTTWSARERHRLIAEQENWRRDGLVLDALHLQPPAVPDDQNAAVSLLEAEAAYQPDVEFGTLINDYWFDYSHMEHSTEATLRIVDRMLKKNARAIAFLHRAATQPSARWPDQTTEFRLASNPLQGLWGATTVLSVHASRAMMRGDEAAFLKDVTALRAIRRVLAANPSIYTHMFGWNVSNSSGDLIDQYVPLLKLTEPAARKAADSLLAEMLNEPAAVDDLVVPLEREAAMMVDGVQAGKMSDNMPRGRLGATVWRILRPAATERSVAALEISRRDIHTLRAQPFGVPRKLWNGMPPTRRPREVEPAESILLGLWPQTEWADRWVGQAYIAAFSHRLACTVLACRLYRLDHDGHNPSHLIELVPRYLPALPLDPYDKAMGPMRYTTATTRPFVYSIGPGGQDRIATGRALPRDENAKWGFNPGAFVGTGRPATQPK